MPYPIATITPYEHKDEYDSGDYQSTLEPLPRGDRLDRQGKAAGPAGRRALSWHRGRLLRRGRRGGSEGDRRLAINDDGSISVFIGSSAVGQGVETVFAQIAADALEIPMDRIRGVYHGSTAYVSDGYGAYHSRSIVMGGSALVDAANNFQAALREAAAKRLGCEPPRSRFARTRSSAGGKSLPLSDVCRTVAGRRLPQPQAHLQLWRTGGARRRRRQDRPCRDSRLRRGRRMPAASSIR